MEVLVLDGKNYVKASKAARDLGYATDYVGQLCRSGQIDAHLIGRTWYVHQEQLSTYRVEKKRMSKIKAREYAKKTIAEFQAKAPETKNNYRNIDIQYESDSSDLIPATRKLTITNTSKALTHIDEDFSETVIENPGEKIKMSGDLNIVDVTDGPVDGETTILTPSRFKKGVPVVEEPAISDSAFAEIEAKVTAKRPSFEERLQTQQLDTVIEESVTEMPTPSTAAITHVQPNNSGLVYHVLFVLSLCTLVTVAISTVHVTTYAPDKIIPVEKSIQLDFKNSINILRSKI